MTKSQMVKALNKERADLPAWENDCLYKTCGKCSAVDVKSCYDVMQKEPKASELFSKGGNDE